MRLVLIGVCVCLLVVAGCKTAPSEQPVVAAPIETPTPQEQPVQNPAIDPSPTPSLGTEKTVVIAPNRVDCIGEAPQKCLLMDGNLFYDSIEGFTHEEGYTYTLRIRVHTVQNPPADGSSFRYELVDVLSQKEHIVKKQIFEDFGEQLQICPDEWYDNQMPTIECDDCTGSQNEYFILDGARRELAEFDLGWVVSNCDIEPTVVV